MPTKTHLPCIDVVVTNALFFVIVSFQTLQQHGSATTATKNGTHRLMKWEVTLLIMATN
jgi:hypothetical protein